MVDAGFVDLVRPAMHGSYHHITVHGADPATETSPVLVAGPLCESGDVFTRDARELLGTIPCSGKRIHDAHLVATALVHRVKTIATLDTGDFSAFRSRVNVVSLAEG